MAMGLLSMTRGIPGTIDDDEQNASTAMILVHASSDNAKMTNNNMMTATQHSTKTQKVTVLFFEK